MLIILKYKTGCNIVILSVSVLLIAELIVLSGLHTTRISKQSRV